MNNVIKISRQSLANAGKNARGTEEVEKEHGKSADGVCVKKLYER